MLTFYSQLWALAHFLMEGEGGRYAPSMRAIISDAAEGRLSLRVFPGDRLDSMLFVGASG